MLEGSFYTEQRVSSHIFWHNNKCGGSLLAQTCDSCFLSIGLFINWYAGDSRNLLIGRVGQFLAQIENNSAYVRVGCFEASLQPFLHATTYLHQTKCDINLTLTQLNFICINGTCSRFYRTLKVILFKLCNIGLRANICLEK